MGREVAAQHRAASHLRSGERVKVQIEEKEAKEAKAKRAQARDRKVAKEEVAKLSCCGRPKMDETSVSISTPRRVVLETATWYTFAGILDVGSRIRLWATIATQTLPDQRNHW